MMSGISGERPASTGRGARGAGRGVGPVVWLVAAGGYAAFREGGHGPATGYEAAGYEAAGYELRADAGGAVLHRLDGVQWADWAHDGQLLVATADGRLQRRHPQTLAVGWEHDLAPLRPDPQPPPAHALHW
jgi:hypothetical protein